MALAFAALGLGATAFAAAKQAAIDQVAPPFTLKMFDKSKKTLADYRGKVLVINYWATWCGPCKTEMPMMSKYHRLNKARGFEIIGVVTKDSVKPFQLTKVAEALSYPLALDLKGSYGVIGGAVPSNYVIDRRGNVRYAKAGSFDAGEFKELIEPLLNE